MLIRPTKVLRTAPGQSAERWSAALADPAWLAAANVLKEDSGSWVRRASILGRDVVVKCRALNTFSRRLKSNLGIGHGHKHWRGAKLLQSRGILTAAPLVLCRATVDGAPCEVLVLEFIEGPTLLECMQSARDGTIPIREQHAIARAVGVQVARFSQGLQNRDHKPSNLIVPRSAPNTPGVAVIDCVGVYHSMLWRGFFPPLASLLIEPTGCGVPPRRTLRMRALTALADSLNGPIRTSRAERRKFIRLVWLLTDERIAAHGDPTPKVNPLSPPRA